jgi:hypothetical protein
MRNKRGFVFALWIPVLTVIMCGIVAMNYLDKQPDVDASLVSPLAVLEVRDDLEIFEMREMELILEYWDKDLFKEKFVDGLTDEMREFIFSDLIWEGNVMDRDFDRDSFLNNVLYSVREDSGNLILERARIGKRLLLESEDLVKASFSVSFEFEFEREYLIDKDGNVEVVV